jgi:hypothetical protein
MILERFKMCAPLAFFSFDSLKRVYLFIFCGIPLKSILATRGAEVTKNGYCKYAREDKAMPEKIVLENIDKQAYNVRS